MNQRRQRGEEIRRQVMSDPFVDRALNNTSEFDQPLQELVMETAWGTVWDRDDLPRPTRSLITIAMLAAMKCPNELKGHVRGALRNGCSAEEIRAVLLHAVPYIGAPASLEAFRAAREVVEQWQGENPADT
ncbi:MAG: carboxymuconolactone decarboxylase family protein [Cellvibrionaceae bacterium]|nr:carboxymuconolactone decarboxylase family protein [Cellvibrionaceae bacterium]MCV6627778.1 carboxymuconolactone decarboxylase family protein [Cellvibrionaceae bacterium]